MSHDYTCILHDKVQKVYPNPEDDKGLTKCTPNEFVPSMFGDGLRMENFLGVLNIFVLLLQIPTYLGSRGVLFFYTYSFFQQYASAG